MPRTVRILLFVSLILALGLGGCLSSDDDTLVMPSAQEKAPSESGDETSTDTLESLLASQGLAFPQDRPGEITVCGHTGYLAQYSGKFTGGVYGTTSDSTESPEHPKYCLITTGSPYSMGFQTGYLMAEETAAIADQFIKYVIWDELKLLGIDLGKDSALYLGLVNLLLPLVEELCLQDALSVRQDGSPLIPTELIEEMQGVAAGATERLAMEDLTGSSYAGTEVNFSSILMVNQAIETLLSMLASALLPGSTTDAGELMQYMVEYILAHITDDLKGLIASSPLGDMIQALPDGSYRLVPPAGSLGALRLGCNEFMVTGQATADGKTYHGRDFMFATAGIWQDTACIRVVLPQEGHALAATAPPGFLSFPDGVNEHGVSMAVDMVFGATFAARRGLSCLTLIRDILQHSTTMDEAIARFRATPRGTSWIYILCDDTPNAAYGNGAVLESGRSAPAFTGPDALPDWEQLLLSPVSALLDPAELNAEGFIEDGVMIRGSAWTFPEEFAHLGLSLPLSDPRWPGLDHLDLGLPFPQQGETWSDVVATTNHYIIPRMSFTALDPLILIGYGLEPLPESVWRYEALLELLEENYGEITFFGDNPDYPASPSAGWIIDLLNPNFANPNLDADEYPTNRFYTDKDKPLNGHVEGHHAVYDNTDRQMRALFGYMDDPWVGISLMPLIEWYRGETPQ